ncbi:uncharacterized protein DNG_01559 [Cephalotrichum gorgonifer]|uniref:Uncharacterized protein n=1 Tax=Cephalotrichum gorgonifer TaxID=2041049 RepID=A0AAE8MRX5_9PEZI|nr:uncharacterized protein DNG_01559 [Cephalotrichum gorgonifer]
MGKASEKAKAKLDLVLNNPNRHDSSGKFLLLVPSPYWFGMKDRVLPTRYPSAGNDGETNRVERRMSQTYQDQAAHAGRIRSMMKNIWGPPAY